MRQTGRDANPAADAAGSVRVATIRSLNDAFRTSFVGGTVMMTAGVAALPEIERRALLRAVRAFEAFDTDNDPHGEHDFGAIDQDGARYFWKIEYYDIDLSAGSPDPSDPQQTRRVLTIMRAEDY
ncbi:DUF3768 domain-containing protein [Aminobacter aganoensis]|uniref:DUF3768 domain-containing protein n=1 Tax=Aminobacter aganoensis TaxID=83264 RepID=A0A7X0KMP2_9HYPH|nr:DUF3768 domain-containing protein [Aminobacter aganoensis]MBB6356326.1 hypothetical protein [Aminobacter aganoensis]